MTPSLDISADGAINDNDHIDKRGHKGPQRRCLVHREVYDKSELVRFVIGPDGQVVPDIAEKLPGRGVWVRSDRASLEKAVRDNLFARGFKSNVMADAALADQTAALLRRRLLSLLTMAVKAGDILMGFDQVKSAAQSAYLAWRIEAHDGAPAGRGKIRVLTKAVSHELEKPLTPVIGCLSAQQLGEAMGREHVVHAALKPGRLASAFSYAAARYSGFEALIPADWPDLEHEQMANKKRDKG